MLVMISNTINVYANAIGMVGVIPLEGHSKRRNNSGERAATRGRPPG
jgi:hypothetical protein